MSGVAAGVNDTARQAGIAVGVAALGALIPAEHAFGGDPGEYVSGMHDALLAGGILAAVGALAGWFLISSKYGAAAEAPAAEETKAAPAAHAAPGARRRLGAQPGQPVRHELRDRQRGRGGRRRRVDDVQRVRRLGEREVVEQGAVAADAPEPGPPRVRARRRPGRSPARSARGRARRAGGSPRCAISRAPVRHQRRTSRAVPGQRSVAPRSARRTRASR